MSAPAAVPAARSLSPSMLADPPRPKERTPRCDLGSQCSAQSAARTIGSRAAVRGWRGANPLATFDRAGAHNVSCARAILHCYAVFCCRHASLCRRRYPALRVIFNQPGFAPVACGAPGARLHRALGRAALTALQPPSISAAVCCLACACQGGLSSSCETTLRRLGPQAAQEHP